MDEKHSELKKIFAAYWPPAVSWLFMAVDTPAITAVVSRMNDPQNVPAAHGMTYPVRRFGCITVRSSWKNAGLLRLCKGVDV